MRKAFFIFCRNIDRNRKLPGIVDRLFVAKLREIPFIVFLSFLLTFIITRAYVYATNHEILEAPFLLKNVSIHGVHIHHLNYGIFIMAIVGFLALYNMRPAVHRKLAIFFGIGLGLTFDEFALWLRLQNDYYARISYDAIITISIILLSAAYFPDFWARRGPWILKTTVLLLKKLRDKLCIATADTD